MATEVRSFPAVRVSAAAPAALAPRLDSVDLLRGVIMAIMALDHVRDYFTHLRFSPEEIPLTWPALFFTRWITHFCAPLFFFLAGTGAYLAATRGKSKQQIAHFLWTRGLWLVFLELTVVGFGWTFTFWNYGGVIWALGWSMVVLSFLVRLPVKWVAAFGLVMIFGHNLLDRLQPQQFGKLAPLWILLHSPDFIPVAPKLGLFFVLYVLVPWMGVMAAGYAFGVLVSRPAEERRKAAMYIGLAATALFIVLRATNFYGNPHQMPSFFGEGEFHLQATLAKSVMAFLDTMKYPPSLQYLLMTIGPGLITLSLFDRLDLSKGGPLHGLARGVLVFGRVPMFYYLCHIYLIHIMAIVAAAAFGQPWKWLFGHAFMNAPTPAGYGHNLGFIYLMWVTALVILYFPCRWWAEYKRTHREWWVSYI
jgi:uncharacterized membrane protein